MKNKEKTFDSGILLRRIFSSKKRITIILMIAALGLLYVGFLQWKIVETAGMKKLHHADYLIILGTSVKGTTPSSVLQSRIDTAAVYLKENKSTIVIASGGKGPGEKISEAESIKSELVKKGIKRSRIILENQSTNTYENITFSKKLLPHEVKTGIVVTNQFHLYRAVMMAKDAHLDASGLPAKTPILAIPKSYLREYLAITKYYVLKIFS